MAKTFYDIFEVDISATPEEIRAAYKRMVQRHHPDKNRGHASSEDLLKAINYAYSILSDARKRASYDSKLVSVAHGSAAPADSAYVYTGEATANGAVDPQAARDAGAETVASRLFETRASGWSQVSDINSWLALSMLTLLFLAVSRFFYQVVAYGVLSTAEPGSATLFYGLMIGVIIAGGAVWLAGKMVAYTLPLAWPMNLIFRAKVRSDLNPDHRRIASVVLIMGILLTLAVPNLDKQDDLATPPMATAPTFAPPLETPVAAQSPRKNATTLPEAEFVSPVILARNVPPTPPSDAMALQVSPAPLPPVAKKSSVMIVEPPPSPVKVVVPPVRTVVAPAPRAAPAVVAEARVKPVEQEKPAAKPKPPAVTLPAKVAVTAPVATPPPTKTVVAPAPRAAPEAKKHNVPVPAVVAEARAKPVEQEKPAAKPKPPAVTLPAKVAVTAPVARPPPTEKKKTVSAPLPERKVPTVVATARTAVEKKPITPPAPTITPAPVPALALVTPESTAVTAKVASEKNIAAKKEIPVLQNDADEGGPTLSRHRKRAQQGAADAQYQLGRAYEKGEGAARNYRQAEAWYRKAADQGYGPAQHSLGSMYMLGKGMAMDPVSAYVWLSRAANNNVTSGQQAMDYLVDTLTPAQLADAKRKVAKGIPPRER